MAEDIFEGVEVAYEDGVQAEDVDVEEAAPGVALVQPPQDDQVGTRHHCLHITLDDDI